MKHSSLSKSKYTSYNVGSVNKLFKPSELNFKIPSNASTLNVDKETKLPSGTFRPGATLNVPKNKYKTSKNSPERFDSKQQNRNQSSDKKSQETTKGLVNSSGIKYGSKLKGIIEESSVLENIIKRKILKKNEKAKSNILNFSNPFNNVKLGGSGYYRFQLETSGQNTVNHNKNPTYLQTLKKEILNFKLEENNDKKDKDKPEFNETYKSGLNSNIHKRSTSLIEDDEPISQRNEFRKSVMSPRMENIINKYYEILDKKETNLKKSIFIANSKSKYVANNSTTSNVNESSGYPNQTTNIKFFNNSNIIKKINSQITKAGPNLSSTQKSFNYKPDIPNYNVITNTTHNNSSNILGDNSKRSHYESQKQQPKTTIGSKKNSRKNSIDKTNIKNSNKNNKNLFLVTNTHKTMKASSNTSTNNSSSTLLSGNNKMANFNNMHLDLDNIQSGVEKSNILKKANFNSMAQKSNYHNKMNSEIPVLSSINMNLLQNKNNPLVNLNINSNNFNKNFVYNNSNLKYMNSKATSKSIMTTTINNPNEEKTPEKLSKKKIVPVTMPGTHLNSKNNSKNNSKSMSRIEELVDTPNNRHKVYSKMSVDFNNNKQKSNSLIKKHSPFTSTHSPKNYLNKELPSHFKIKYDQEAGANKIKMTAPATPAEPNKNEKVIVKSLELGSIANKFETKKTSNKMSIEKQESDCKRTSIDYLNISNESVKSTMRESNYYRRECEKVSNYIKQYFYDYNDYPKTKSHFYKYGRLLGRGAFGKVNLSLHVGAGRLVAIKSFNKSKLTSEKARKKIVHETGLLKMLNHPSVVRFYETFDTNKYIMIVMEYVSCGDLLSFVRKRSKLNETIARFIFKQIMEGLSFIHSQGVVHRDIKLDNILIDLQNNIKICDFGVSKEIKRGDIMHDQCGTPAYIAPEILKNQGYEGFGVDMWSSGVVLYAMLSGTVPFKANNMNELHKIIIKGYFQPIKDITDEAQSLVNSLLEVDPKKRIGVDSVLNHPWLRNIEKNKNKMNLFTAAEKVLLAKSNIDYRNANKDDLIEMFTLKNLDTQQETQNQNINTKSNILAPFNSSINSVDSFLHRDLEIENNVIKLAGKVKEINRQYELNNNGEIDNGIIISPQDNSIGNTPNYSPFIPSPFNNSINNGNGNKKSKQVSPRVLKISSPKEDLVSKNQIKGGTYFNSNFVPFAVNDKIIKKVEELGYKKENIVKWLLNNEINYATAAYYLFINFELD